MLLRIPNLLNPEQVHRFRERLLAAAWVDGRSTAGHAAQPAKRNQQLAPDHPATQQLGDEILGLLGGNALFMSAALPLKVFPPRFNRYADGGTYDFHVDGSVMSVPGTPHRVRTDVSSTLFLNDPDDYDGGELVIQDSYGEQRVKLPAGDLVIYPGTSLHKVTPVTRGERLASFFWTQSLVRDDGQRAMLFEMDGAIQALSARDGNAAEVARLLGVYHNLLRHWSDT